MKLRFKLAGIEVAGVKIDNIEVATEYSLHEITGEYALVKQIIKELPEVMTDLKAGFVKFTEIDNEFKEAENAERREYETKREEELSAKAKLIAKKIKIEEEIDQALEKIQKEREV